MTAYDINTEDKALALALADGDNRIFEYIFLSYYSGLVAYAVRMGCDRMTAEDIVSDFFVKLWSKRKEISLTTSLRAYMFSSIKNKCIDYAKHRNFAEKVIDDFRKTDEGEYECRDYAIESELRERIRAAISKLPPKCRKIFVLNQIKGKKPSEIAEMEDISVRTVENHIGKAYRLLRKDLGGNLLILFLLLLQFKDRLV